MRKVAICALGLVLALSVAAQAEDLDEVLQNYYEAVGGLDAWMNVKSLHYTGTMSMGEGMDMPFSFDMKRPGKFRQEFEVQGMKGIMAGDGENYWMHMPFMGQTDPQPMPDEQIKQMSRQAEIETPLMGYEDKNMTLELVGKEDLEGTEVYNIKVTREDGDVEHYFLDAEYYVPLQAKMTTEVQGQEMEMSLVFGDYKEVGGLMIPHSMQVVGGGGGTVVFSTVEVDGDVDDSIFVMPEPAPAAEGGEG